MTAPKWTACALALCCSAAQAAKLDADRISICDRTLAISETLRPAPLMEAAASPLAEGRFPRIYALFAERYEATLTDAERTRPEVSRFLAKLRAATFDATLFDVVPNDTKTREVIFEGSTSPVEIDCATLVPSQSDMAAVSLMTAWVRGREKLPAFKERAHFVAEQSRAHEALLKNGLPMWPWEMSLNGARLGKSDWEPLFRMQVVFMRPTAGLEMGTRSRAEGNLDASAGVEPLGFVRYRNEDYSSWWGASLLVTSSTREGIGIGGLLRWNNYVLGVTRHQSDTPGKGDSNFLFVGLDLYQMVNNKREEFSEWKARQKSRLDELLK